jgi:hypothetical protein
MKIDPAAPQRQTPLRRAGAAGGARSDAFAKALADSGAASSLSGGSPIGALNAMLSLQEVPDALDSQGRAKRRGEQVLDLLDRVRLGILAGTLTVAQLTELAQLVRARRDRVDDPRLAEILDEIELRAEVELAKFARRD